MPEKSRGELIFARTWDALLTAGTLPHGRAAEELGDGEVERLVEDAKARLRSAAGKEGLTEEDIAEPLRNMGLAVLLALSVPDAPPPAEGMTAPTTAARSCAGRW